MSDAVERTSEKATTKIKESDIIEKYTNDGTEKFSEKFSEKFNDEIKISESDIFTDKELYSFEDMKKLNIKEIYYLLKNSNLIMFVNESTIKMKIGFGCFGHKFGKVGILMISSKFIDSLKKIIHKWNNYLNNSKLYKNKNVTDVNDDIMNSVIFEDNNISVKTLYTKMTIKDKIIFYQYKDIILKKMEYKLRGFCQIMEEMGASKININFDCMNKKLTKGEVKMQAKFNKMIAGNLGFSSITSSANETNQTYELSYPDYNNTILNKNEIERKIKEGKFIINYNDYQSNLEFQSVVQSRCNHFINQYSTIFSISNESILESSVEMFLAANSIEFGQSMTLRNEFFSQTILKTHVTFIDDSKIYSNLNSKSISLDETGFKFLMKSLQSVDFNTIGILKINNFIDDWINEKLKNFNGKNYYLVISILNEIKKNIEFNDYNNLLLEYFSKDSQWIHFTNFINVITNKTTSYSKLGYLVLISNEDNCKIKIIDYFIKLFFKLTKNRENIQQIFSHEISKLIFFYDHYFLKVNHLSKFNWDNILSLVKYFDSLPKICISDKDFFIKSIVYLKNFNKYYFFTRYYKKVINNKLHFKYYESKDKDYICEYFFEYIKLYNIIDYNIDTMDKFNKMIETKMKKFKTLKKFFKSRNIIDENTDLYCTKKIKSYYKNEDTNIVNKYLINDYHHKVNLFKNICYYNDKIDFSNEICDYYNYNILKRNLHFGFNSQNQLYKYIEKIVKQIKNLISVNSYGYLMIDNVDIDSIANNISISVNFSDFINDIITHINKNEEIIPKNICEYLINI